VNSSTPKEFEEWYEHLKRYGNAFPARGTISGALVVLERLKSNPNLDIDAHTAKGGAQIIGASGESIKRILNEFGESRPFVNEGGRTNRGLRGDIKTMLDAIRVSGFEELTIASQKDRIIAMQKFLVQKVVDYHNLQRIKYVYYPAKTTWENIHELLAEARTTNKEGAVAQYLVGAKLALRFPNLSISNESYSTADVQLGRVCDFLIGNSAIHVTLSPMGGIYDKCRRNIEQGYRPHLLVPHDILFGTKQNADHEAPEQIAVESLESFISQNIEEINEFSGERLHSGMRKLLEMYNSRVDQADNDKSILIEIPNNLIDA
jgi:hypothetical protein